MKSTYSVNVRVVRVSNGNSYDSKALYFSRWSAVYMAREYYKCEDVISVDVIDNSTGEVLYFHNPYEEWEAEN